MGQFFVGLEDWEKIDELTITLKIITSVATYKFLAQDIDKCNLKEGQNIRCQIDLEI